MTEMMPQKVARAIYEGRNGRGCTPWSRLSVVHQAPYLADARAAIGAMVDDDPAKAFWQDWAAKRLEISRSQWLRAAKRALGGDNRDLRLRVDLAEAPPMPIVASDAALSEPTARERRTE